MTQASHAIDLVGPSTIQIGSMPTRQRLTFAANSDKLTHNTFRYPAKFHPPVARSLVERYTSIGDTVLDPFCGSGTTLIEAIAADRNAIGTDIDPLAAFIANAKTRPFDLDKLRGCSERLQANLCRMSIADRALWGDYTADIAQADYAAAAGELAAWIPELPRIDHWFRRRVVLQLAAIRRLVEVEPEVRDFARLCFGSIIRNASNADPVPVSGLEVTSHMRAKEAAGRVIDPYALMTVCLRKTVKAFEDLSASRKTGRRVRVVVADARSLDGGTAGRPDAIITSPPYLTAVDYYRRHTLEMYWLGLTATSQDRLQLLPGYLGRDRVAQSAVNLDACSRGATIARRWSPRFGEMKPERARAFAHYCVGMAQSLDRMASLLRRGGHAVVVVGDVRFNGRPVSMSELLEELVPDRLLLSERLWYPIANRYMSYTRRNDADIDSDHVLAFTRV